MLNDEKLARVLWRGNRVVRWSTAAVLAGNERSSGSHFKSRRAAKPVATSL